MYEEIRKQAENVANEICDAGKLKKATKSAVLPKTS